MSGAVSDFDAAKTISDLLKDMDSERQRRILRWVSESLNLSMGIGAPAQSSNPAPFSAGQQTPAQPARASDIKTFVDQKAPKSDVQFATVVAYYYRFEAPADQRLESITAEHLQNATRLAGRSRLKRPLVTLSNAKRQGYLDTAERGAFRVNSVGENLVAMTLPGGGAVPQGKQVKRTKSQKKKPKRSQK